MSGTETGFIDSLLAAARENPLAAALIGGGALWMLVGDEKLKSAAMAVTSSGKTIANSSFGAAAAAIKPAAAPPTAPEMVAEGSFGPSQTLRDAGEAVSETISETAGRVRDRFEEGVAFARQNLNQFSNPLPGKETLTNAQSSLTTVLERQPLALGVVGLAIGAAIAAAFRTSDAENKYVGGISDDVKADLEMRAGAVSKSLQQASETLAAEIGDTGAEAMDRVKQAGMDAVQAAHAQIKSPS
jgi:hypothetical protein